MLRGEGHDPERFQHRFQWAPTLGGECYGSGRLLPTGSCCFNGHPPLGVNATADLERAVKDMEAFVSMGTHPWG